MDTAKAWERLKDLIYTRKQAEDAHSLYDGFGEANKFIKELIKEIRDYKLEYE